MAAFVNTLRDGDWLTPGRARLWALAVLFASGVGLVWLVATSDGLNDYQGRPLGTDFSNTYVAGSYILEGRPEAPFDHRLQYARAQQIFGEKTDHYAWHYPPFFHFIAAPLATMPYWLALVVWQASTLALYLIAIHSIISRGSCSPSPLWGEGRGEGASHSHRGAAPHPAGFQPSDLSPPGRGVLSFWLLLALAYPAVFINIGHGHNGFLTAALVALALIHLDSRPILAGVLFGLLAYKPQFGLLLPLVLAVTGRWRVIFAAAATVVALTLAVTLVFGVETWRAFFASAAFSREVLETGGRWHMIQSVYSWVRLWGGGVSLAYALQGATTLAVAASLVWLWRAQAAFALKAAALCLGMILAMPYSLDYDMMVLAPAIAFLGVDGLRRGFAPYEITALAALWAVPLVARGIANMAFIPLGTIMMLATFALIMRRAQADLAAADTGIPLPAAR